MTERMDDDLKEMDRKQRNRPTREKSCPPQLRRFATTDISGIGMESRSINFLN